MTQAVKSFRWWRFDGWSVDRRNRELLHENGKHVSLEGREFEILDFLIQHKNDFFSYKDIIDKVWDILVEPNNAEQAITGIRRKLRSLGLRDQEVIESQRGKGCRFVLTPVASEETAPVKDEDSRHQNRALYDVAFARLVARSKDARISAYPVFGWGTTLSLQDAPQYEGWPMSDVEMLYKPNEPFQLDEDKQQQYQRYVERYYEQKRFSEDNVKLMLEQNPVAFTDAPSLCLTVRTCKWSETQFYRDNVANSYEREGLIEDLTRGSLRVRFPHSLCVHMAIITADKKVLITQRSPKVAYYPNAWSCSAEENLAVSDLKAGENTRVLACALRLLDEELGLNEKAVDPSGMCLLSVFLESDILNISLCAEATLKLDSSELDLVLQGHRRKDLEFMQWHYLDLDRTRLLKEIMRPKYRYHPTSGYRLVQVFLKHFGVPRQIDMNEVA